MRMPLPEFKDLFIQLDDTTFSVREKLGDLKEGIKNRTGTNFNNEPRLTTYARLAHGIMGTIVEYGFLRLWLYTPIDLYSAISKAITLPLLGYVGLDTLASAVTGIDMPIHTLYRKYIRRKLKK